MKTVISSPFKGLGGWWDLGCRIWNIGFGIGQAGTGQALSLNNLVWLNLAGLGFRYTKTVISSPFRGLGGVVEI